MRVIRILRTAQKTFKPLSHNLKLIKKILYLSLGVFIQIGDFLSIKTLTKYASRSNPRPTTKTKFI